MNSDTLAILVTIALFGVGNGGLFLYKFGALSTRVQMNEERLDRYGARLTEIADSVNRMKGEVRA